MFPEVGAWRACTRPHPSSRESASAIGQQLSFMACRRIAVGLHGRHLRCSAAPPQRSTLSSRIVRRMDSVADSIRIDVDVELGQLLRLRGDAEETLHRKACHGEIDVRAPGEGSSGTNAEPMPTTRLAPCCLGNAAIWRASLRALALRLGDKPRATDMVKEYATMHRVQV